MGIVLREEQEQVVIPRGVRSDQIVKVALKGHQSLKHANQNGDLLVRVKVRAHPSFKRVGDDIVTEKNISVA